MIELDGAGGAALVRAICSLMPLDESADPVIVMDLMDEHKAAGWQPPPVGRF